MITRQKIDIEKKLREIVDEIAVPEGKYEEAKTSYEAIGEWLASNNSNLQQYKPKIYPQGSFAFGTAIKPSHGCDYDVDAVCLLQASKHNFTQEELKNLVGGRLKEHGTYSRMLEPKDGRRRCWTLEYSDKSRFHIDILPAIPFDVMNFSESAYINGLLNQTICITDKLHRDYKILSNDWHTSNPQGYINWFFNEMRQKMQKNARVEFAANESVEDLPLYKRKTVLQMAIQLLKYHRDINWRNDDDKPISIIITTLATKAYNGEDNLYDALVNICKTMPDYIENRNDTYWVGNPVNENENFADKWKETPRKAQVFFQWLFSLNTLLNNLLDEHIDFSEALEIGRAHV